MKEIFEKWMLDYFGEKIEYILNEFNGDTYQDETINNLWVGFKHGMMISGNLAQKHPDNCGCTHCS